ncbi:MAG TPA: hypothetical protein PKI63_09765 [Candidatus Cloacimonadota bacterium]|nr:hypothetical protein [Candidatus Cloacimonadota bacterium]
MKYLLPILLVLLAACSAPRNQEALNTDPSHPCILVAIQKGADSPFKQGLITRLKQDYSPEYQVLTKEVKSFKDLEKEQYSALIVMDQLKAWLLMNGGLKNIAKHADKSKTVYFISAGDAKWKWKRTDLKHVSSATQKLNPDQTYTRIKAWLDPILQKQ